MFHLINVGSTNIDPGRVNLSLTNALRWGGQARTSARADARFDADVAGYPDLLDDYHRHFDATMLASRLDRADARGRDGHMSLSPAVIGQYRETLDRHDALPAGVNAFPQEFEHVRARAFEEKRAPLNGRILFATDSSVPLGARSHRAYRTVGNGEAQIVSKGSPIPRATTGRVTESFLVAYVACGVSVNYFDALTTDFANLRQYQNDLAMARYAVNWKINDIIWNGDEAAGLYGVLNYPHIAKMVIATPFTDASNASDVAQEINDFLDTPMLQSKTVYQPNALIVSPAINSFISSRQHSVASDVKIKQYVLAAQEGRISSIQVAQELAGAGPNGEDVMIAYRKEPETLAHVEVQAPTTLPVFQSTVFDTETVVIGATGGMISAESGNVIIGYVDVGN